MGPEQVEGREAPTKRPAPTGPIDRVGAKTLRSLHGKEPVQIGCGLEHAASFQAKSLYLKLLEVGTIP